MERKTRNCKTAMNAAVIGGDIYFEDVRQCGLEDEKAAEILDDKHLKAIRVVSISNDWQQRVWLDNGQIITEQINFEMTLRKEKYGRRWHWYAYRRVLGKLHKRYVGYSEQITEQKLLDIARAMPSR